MTRERILDADRTGALLSQWVGLLVFLAIACLFLDRRWSGYLTSTTALMGLVLFAVRREFDHTDRAFLVVAALLPAAYLLNMLIHGFAGSIFDRPSRLLIGFFAFYAIRRAAPPPILFFDGCATAAVAAGLIAIHQVGLLGAERASAGWNAVPFGNYSILLGFLVLCALLAGWVRSPARLTWYAAALVLSGVALALSRTRGSWLAVPVLLVLVSYARAHVPTRYRMGAAAAVLVAAAALAATSSGLQQRLRVAVDEVAAYVVAPESTQVQDTPVGMRLAMWRWGWEQFSERPLVGMGLAHYDERRRAAVERGALPGQFLAMANIHNQLLHFLAVGGLLMGAMLIAFWVLAVRFFLVLARDADAAAGGRAFPVAGLCVVAGTALFSMSGGLFGTSPDSWAFATLLCMTAGFAAGSSDARLHVSPRAA